MKYLIAKNSLIIEDKHTVEFEFPIKKTLEIEELLIVLIESPMGKIYNDNVFCVNSQGKIIWQVPRISSYPGNTKDCSFVGMTLNEKRELVLFNWCDLAVVIDFRTGSILSQYEQR